MVMPYQSVPVYMKTKGMKVKGMKTYYPNFIHIANIPPDDYAYPQLLINVEELKKN